MARTSKTLGALLIAIALFTTFGCNSGDSPDASAATAATATPESAAPATASIPGLPARPASDPLRPVVVMETSVGAVTVKLDAEKAPLTVENFLAYVDSGFYDQTIIHQAFRGQGVLGGGYGLDYAEKPARTPIRNEAHNGLKNRRGTIAMARTIDAIDSARTQFLFSVADNESLDHRDRTPEGYGYCVFGEVTVGLEVLDKIANAPVHDTPDFDRTPTQPIVVKSVRRLR
jgi:cyclophilin family peptidyl-prolyl cis-trans isomerase